MSKVQTRKNISVSAAFFERLRAHEMPELDLERAPNARTGTYRRKGKISRTGFVEMKINEALDREGWPRNIHARR